MGESTIGPDSKICEEARAKSSPESPNTFWSACDVLVLKPSKGWAVLDLGCVWAYRELLYFLAWRDVKVRYKQTILGAAWAVLQPVMVMVVFTIFFGNLAEIDKKISVPYPLFAFCALLPWQLFSYAMNQSSASLVGNQHLITKVYFPRLIIPLSSVLAGLVDFLIAFVVLLVMLACFGVVPTLSALYLLPLILLTIVSALGVGLWLSAMNVKYRDVRYTIPFLTQLWLFITPIAYPSSLVPGKWQIVYSLNPMVGVVEGFRWAILGSGPAPGLMVFVSALACVLILISGLYYFRRVERTFADVV